MLKMATVAAAATNNNALFTQSNMNATLITTTPLPNAGTNEISSPILEELWETYLFAGLPFDTAMAAAIADYADLFIEAA